MFNIMDTRKACSSMLEATIMHKPKASALRKCSREHYCITQVN